MPLVIAPRGESLRIVKVLTDVKTKKYLESLGLVVNGDVTVLSSSGGTVVCKIKDGKVALDSSISTKILVV